MAQALLEQLKNGQAKFADVISYIEQHYTHTPTAFQNGAQHNASTDADNQKNQGEKNTVISFHC